MNSNITMVWKTILVNTQSFLSTFLSNFGMFLRPALLVFCGMLLFSLPTLTYKGSHFIQGLLYMLLCNDKSWKRPQDPKIIVEPLMNDDRVIERKTIYFVRHGESTWNDTFNVGIHRSKFVFALGFLPGLMKAFLYEVYLTLSGKLDSWFYDSPLSNLGLAQSNDLSKFLSESPTLNDTEKNHISILNSLPGSPPSKLVSSNLRRAISTLAVAFRGRLSRRPHEKILVIPALQEISRNPDALSITPAQGQIRASWIDRTSKICNFQGIFTNQVDTSLHTGNKPIKTNGLKRMNWFCEFVFSPSIQEEYVVIGGHSLWFRSFFLTFLPYEISHISKRKKIVNGGIVAFDLIKARTKNGTNHFMIDPKSIEVVYGGFQ